MKIEYEEIKRSEEAIAYIISENEVLSAEDKDDIKMYNGRIRDMRAILREEKK